MAEPPKTPAWEPAAIILAIVALQPRIWAPHLAISDPLMYAAGVAMIVVFVCKVRRFHNLWNPKR